MQYTYENWVNNLFEYSENLSEVIGSIELKQIRKKQKEIFDVLWKLKLEKFINDFEEYYNSSEEKELLINSEQHFIKFLLNGDLNVLGMYRSDVLPDLSQDDLRVIREIVSREIIRGKVFLGNIKSPTKYSYDSAYSKFIPSYGLSRQIIAHAFYHYDKYLNEIKASQNLVSKSPKRKNSFIIWEKSEKELKSFFDLLIQKRCISKIEYKIFKQHFLKEDLLDEKIHWALNIPDLIYLLDTLNQNGDYLNKAACTKENLLLPHLINIHFCYTNNRNVVVPIRANDVSKIRCRTYSSSHDTLMKNIINSI